MSRRTRWIVGVILLGLLIYARQAGYVDAPQHQSDLERKVSGDVPVDDQRTQSDLGRYDRKSFTVVRVIDGDTLDIDIADSTGNWKTTRVRLWGVDTPETHHPNIKSPMFFGPEAAEFTRRVVEGKTVTILLEPQQKSRGKYGRLLGYVMLDENTMLNALLVEQGYAYADTRFDHIYKQRFIELENLARRKGYGLWRLVTVEQMPAWRQRVEAK